MTSADIIEQRVENFYDVKGGFCDWTFNAWGGLVDGLYFPWDNDDKVAGKICELEGVDRYRTEDFVLEGGSIHVDGEGTLITTEMCLLSKGRNPDMSRKQIENKLEEYLNIEKVIWIKDGTLCTASYMNFLIVNDGVIAPRYGDEYDELALEQLQEMFPDRKIVGVQTREVIYGGGNIHCITQHQPAVIK